MSKEVVPIEGPSLAEVVKDLEDPDRIVGRFGLQVQGIWAVPGFENRLCRRGQREDIVPQRLAGHHTGCGSRRGRKGLNSGTLARRSGLGGRHWSAEKVWERRNPKPRCGGPGRR